MSAANALMKPPDDLTLTVEIAPADFPAFPLPESGSGSTGILLSTLWNQSGVISIGDNASVAYNEYTPTDPTTSKHSVTGCTNTAAAQIIYYFIEKGKLDLSLTLVSSDAYTSNYNNNTISVKTDGSTPGTISFAAVNSRLKNYSVSSAECAAALLYACGVIQKANYSSSATSTGWKTDLFYRSGFKSANHLYMGSNSTVYYWGTTDASGKVTISDAGYEVLIENLRAGRPVGTSYPGHAVVIDGYDAENDLFHINFGWGRSSTTRWYSREEMREEGYHEFVYDLFTEYVETFTVTDDRVYGTGTLVRAFEQARTMTGSNIVEFSSSVGGKAVELNENVKIADSTSVRDFNMTVTVTNARNNSWGMGFYGESGSAATFEDFGGALIVDTSKDTNVAMYFYNSDALSFSANHALLYAGSYSVGGSCSAGAAAILDAMRSARDTAVELADFVTDSASYSFYGTDGDDLIALDGKSLVVGNLALSGGNDTVSLTGGSRIYGYINGSGDNTITVDGGSQLHGNIYGGGTITVTDGSKLSGNISGSGTITVDSSSAVTGLIYAHQDIDFVLDSAAADHALFTVESNVYNVYSNAAVTVDIADAEVGTYILFAAADGANYADWLNRMTLTVKGSGQADYTLCGNGTATSDFADLFYEDRMLKLNVKQAPGDFIPKVVSVSADRTEPTNLDVTVTAVFNSAVRTAQYSLNGSTWKSYSSGVVMTANGTVYFRGLDADNNISRVVSYEVTNINKVAPTKPTVTADVTTPTNRNVTVTATYSSDTATKQYSLDNATWKTYSSGVVMDANGTLYFRGLDAAGNISDVTSYEVANIDKVAPDKPTVTANVTAPTNQDVTVTAVYSSDTATKQYSLNNSTWKTYATPVVMTANGTVWFRGLDAAGNISEVASYEVTNIDKTAPTKPTVTANVTKPTDRDVTVTAVYGADSDVKQYSVDGETWRSYTTPVVMTANGTLYFRGLDAAGNLSPVVSYAVTNIDKVAPSKPTVTADVTTPTNRNVTVTATFSDDSDVKQYSMDGETWQSYATSVVMDANGTVYFRAADAAGNISAVASCEVANIDKTAPVITLAGDNGTPTYRTVLTASVDDGSVLYYRVDGAEWVVYTVPIAVGANAIYEFEATDAAGNTGHASITYANILTEFPEKLVGTPDAQSWTATGAERYVVEYSTDGFEHVMSVTVGGNGVDSPELPAGTYQWRVRSENDEQWTRGENIVAESADTTPKVVRSDADGKDDVFFATASGTWGGKYSARHLGAFGDWNGTGETVSLAGKGRIGNFYFGSTDANVLLLTDAAAGDALFVDDVYTALPGEVADPQSRLAQIREIRAGFGNDVVDMTSQRFVYIGGGLIVRGGLGDDVIWANNGDNSLFGDAGNDRLVGASGNDVLAGGAGNDQMHGGGGSDVFVFGDAWGVDTVEQLAEGRVTLWFASGNDGNWDAATLTYADGENLVTVTGVSADRVTLKFGDDGSARYTELTDAGAFAAFTSENVFEKNNFGVPAGF